MKKEEIENRIREIEKEEQELQMERRRLLSELERIKEEEKEKSPNFIKIKCPYCDGKGYEPFEDRKIKCHQCDGKGYFWGEIYRG